LPVAAARIGQEYVVAGANEIGIGALPDEIGLVRGRRSAMDQGDHWRLGGGAHAARSDQPALDGEGPALPAETAGGDDGRPAVIVVGDRVRRRDRAGED